ncbi:MAG TPA: hypothetical protein VKV57_15930 [bacterium]|nr:hypothetical protein [bacterium]
MPLLRTAVLVLLVLGAAAGGQGAGRASAQGAPTGWDPRFNTPGVRFTVEEAAREILDGVTRVTYYPRTSGFPQGKTYVIWTWPLGAAPEKTDFQYRADAEGRLISRGAYPDWDDFAFAVDHFANGMPLRLAVLSTDQAVAAYVKAFPFPIEASDGFCHLQAELLSADGRSFAVSGEGFGPSEEVVVLSRFDGQASREAKAVLDDGSLPTIDITPNVPGKDSGSASLTVGGRFCAPTVHFEWGPPALKAQ